MPKPERKWLLAGTALATGALGAALLQPTPARADPICLESGAPNEWSCEGALGSETFNPDGPWVVEFGNPPGTPVTQTGGTTIDNTGDSNGQFILFDGSTINNAAGHGLVITNTALGPNSTVTLELHDNITAGADGIRVEGGGTVNLDLIDSDVAGGADPSDNGIVVTAIDDLIDISIDATSSVISGDIAILVGQGGTPGNFVAGAVTITNAGVVESTLDRDAISVAATGAINITNETTGQISGDAGIDVIGNNTINITNWGHIDGTFADEGGIVVENTSTTAVTTIKNLSTSTIDAAGDGISAFGAGGAIIVYNGDDSVNPLPLPSNPDGLIDAGEDGIDVTNNNGGNITIYNGLSDTSNSRIFAGGEYGIFANSIDSGTGNGVVSLWNHGYIEMWDDDADAGIYGETSADVEDSYVEVFNGSELVAAPVFNINARINGYDIEIDDNLTPDDPSDDSASFDIYDANGIEVVKLGGTGGKVVPTYDYDTGGTVNRTYGVLTRNYGTWDFTGDDNFLTPGFDEGVALGPDETAASTTGGVFAPGGSAWLARNFSNADTGLWNYGTMIGQGSNFDPVLDIETEHFAAGADSTVDVDVPNAVYIYNAGYNAEMGTFGVIGSEAIPYNWPITPQEAVETGFGFFGESGVDWAFIDTIVGPEGIQVFADASNDQLIVAQGDGGGDGASVFFYNAGFAVGQVELRSVDGSLVVNDGAWFTRGTSQFFGNDDRLVNYGLIQASFVADLNSETEFQSLNQLDNYGVISLLDGGAGDELDIDGNYYGGGLMVPESQGYFALDAYLDGEDNPETDADLFDIDGAVNGTTGLIIRNANADGRTSPNEFGLDVVEYDDGDGSIQNPCAEDGPCKEGDAFFISLLSPNSFALGGGVNGIEDGLYAWYLFQDTGNDDFELRETFVSPGALNAPGIITGAQNIFYSTVSVVEDHSYGFQFAAPGGGGADLAVDAPVYEAPTASGGTRTGLWAKATGSWFEKETTVPELGIDIDTSFDQDIYSVLGGADMKWSEDSPWRIGLFGGYVTSNLDFDLGSDSVDYEGGLVGGYLAYNNGAFYADATVKGDLLKADYSFADTEVDADVTNIGVLANTGYRMHWGGAFLEPTASLAYVHSEVDDFSDGGATVEFSNGESLRAGAGARIGTTFATGGATTELSLLGKVWNEFEDENKVTLTDGVNTTTFSDDISGVFGEVMANVTVTSGDGTLSGFVQGGGKFGDDFTSWDAQVGVRKGF